MHEPNHIEDVNASTISSSSSKMKWFVSPFKECYEKFKESCHHQQQQQPRHCDTDRNRYHYFRKWKNKNKNKNNSGTYKSKNNSSKNFKSQCESVKEVIISPETEREKQTEYENELERIDYVKQLKTIDPENYELGCLMLKWYFENKTRNSATDETIQKKNSQISLPQDTLPLNKKVKDSKRKVVNNNIEKQNIKVKKFRHNPMINNNKDIDTLNEKMVNDLLHMIDDHIDETVRSKRNKLLG